MRHVSGRRQLVGVETTSARWDEKGSAAVITK